MAYFSVIIELIGGKYDYDVPDVQLITGAKYEWNLANRGTPGLPQGTCLFDYPDALGDNLPRRLSVTNTIYDNFATVTLSPLTATITADGFDGQEITAQFPVTGGSAFFTVNFPDGTQEITTVTIDGSGQAVLPANKTTTTTAGTITVVVQSNVWHSVLGFEISEIEAV